MHNNNYTFQVHVNGKPLTEIIENNKTLIGARHGDRYSLYFSNNTAFTKEVSFAIDGKCPSTGKEASSNPKGNKGKFIVQPWSTIELKAWVENNQEGAAFVFSTQENSVAAHTGGNPNYSGLLSVAVFKEELEYVADPYLNSRPYHYASSTSSRSYSSDSPQITLNACETSRGMGTGAGETIQQKITYVKGLNSPILETVMVMKYIPISVFEQILTKLQNPGNVTGFSDYDNRHVNLTGVPRMVSNQAR